MGTLQKTKHVKKSRPDGTNPDDYQKCQSWNDQRWAWEFLRRSKKYIAACERVRAEPDETKNAAVAKFSLKVFKDCDELYSKGSGVPKFDIGNVGFASNLETIDEMPRKKKMKVDDGEVAVRFNLMEALESPAVLKRQLANATAGLNDRLRKFRKAVAPDMKNIRLSNRRLVEYLRILDCTHNGYSLYETAQIVYPNKINIGRIALIDMIKPKKKAANDYTDRKYKYLAARYIRPIKK